MRCTVALSVLRSDTQISAVGWPMPDRATGKIANAATGFSSRPIDSTVARGSAPGSTGRDTISKAAARSSPITRASASTVTGSAFDGRATTTRRRTSACALPVASSTIAIAIATAGTRMIGAMRARLRGPTKPSYATRADVCAQALPSDRFLSRIRPRIL
jgi:hypothetical protein